MGKDKNPTINKKKYVYNYIYIFFRYSDKYQNKIIKKKTMFSFFFQQNLLDLFTWWWVRILTSFGNFNIR